MPKNLINISNTGLIRISSAETLSTELRQELFSGWYLCLLRQPGWLWSSDVPQAELSYHFSHSFTRLISWADFPLSSPCLCFWLMIQGAIHFPPYKSCHTNPLKSCQLCFGFPLGRWSIPGARGSSELQSGACPGTGVKNSLHFRAFLKKASHTHLVKQISAFHFSAQIAEVRLTNFWQSWGSNPGLYCSRHKTCMGFSHACEMGEYLLLQGSSKDNFADSC